MSPLKDKPRSNWNDHGRAVTTMLTRLKFRHSGEVDFRSTIQATVRDFRASEPLDVISARFHNTVVDAIVETCRRIRASGGLKQVCLSGGVFQNFYLRNVAWNIFEAAALRSSCTPGYRQMMAV